MEVSDTPSPGLQVHTTPSEGRGHPRGGTRGLLAEPASPPVGTDGLAVAGTAGWGRPEAEDTRRGSLGQDI